LYGPIAQNAAKKKDVSYSDFLEEGLEGELHKRDRSGAHTGDSAALRTSPGSCVSHRRDAKTSYHRAWSHLPKVRLEKDQEALLVALGHDLEE
jgi:hypothetical protein